MACVTVFSVASAAEQKIVGLTNNLVNGGDYERGRALFFGAQLKCSTCHRIRGEGGTNGLDLSSLPTKDSPAVLQEIKTPVASIHDGNVTYNVKLKDGQELKGLVRAKDARTLRMVEAGGKERLFPRADVKELSLSADSLMPAGPLNSLTGQQVNDLLTFLLNAPLSRSRMEVESAFARHASAPTPGPLPCSASFWSPANKITALDSTIIQPGRKRGTSC